MDNNLYDMIFKRKSFHIFRKDMYKSKRKELDEIWNILLLNMKLDKMIIMIL